MDENVKVSVDKKGISRKKFIIMTTLLIIVLCAISVSCFYYFTKDSKKSVNKEKEVSATGNLFTKDNFPRIDASLATQPLTDAFYSNFTGTELKDVNINYTNTHPGYVKLINGETDLIVVTEPSSEESKLAQEKGVELEVIPVVNEAFVFFVNANNPVNSLTLDQIRGIYTGKITNWKEVGGEDKKILAYQRPKNSGSQTGILSLVMKGQKMKKPLKEEFEESMAGIINAVADYKNSDRSLGYSYYYYATTMYGNDNIKLLGIDNILPNYKNIREKKYPIMTNYYIVLNKNTPKDSNVRKLVKAMLSKRGQKVAKEAGYVPVK